MIGLVNFSLSPVLGFNDACMVLNTVLVERQEVWGFLVLLVPLRDWGVDWE